MNGVFAEFKRFLKLKSILSEQSVETYMKHCRTINNKLNLFSITRRWVEDNILMGEYGNTTKRFYLQALINFFDWMRMEGVKNNNPAKEVKMPANEPPKHKMIDEAIVKVLFKNCRTLREYIAISIYYYCGLRPRELARLKGRDINLVTYRIEIQKGKGGKYRVVPFPPEFEKYYRYYIAKYKIGPNDTVIKSEMDGGSATYSMLKHMIYRMSRRMKIPFSGYRFRHSCITHLWEHGLDPYAMQALAGHASLRTTLQYTKVTIGILQKKYNQVGLYHEINKKEVDNAGDFNYTPCINQGTSFNLPALVGR